MIQVSESLAVAKYFLPVIGSQARLKDKIKLDDKLRTAGVIPLAVLRKLCTRDSFSDGL